MQLAFEQEYYRIQEIVKKNNKRAIKGNGLQLLLKDIVDSNVSLNYSTKRSYIPGCVAVYDGDFYVCNTSTSGVWVPANWTAINWSSFHPYTDDYEARVVAAGDTLNSTRKGHINTFFNAIDSHLPNIARLGMWLSDTFTGAMVPLIYNFDGSATPIGNTTDTNNNFVSGDWGLTSGLTPDGATKYLDTGVNPSTVAGLGQDDISIGVWAKTVNNGRFNIGVGDGGTNYLMLSYAFAGFTGASVTSVNSAYLGAYWAAQTAGLLIASRSGSGSDELYKNGSLVSSHSQASTTELNGNIYVFVDNNVNLFGSQWYTTDVLHGYIIAKGLDATANTDIYNAWNTLHTNVGR